MALYQWLSAFWACFLISGSNQQQLEKSRSVWVEQGLVRGKIYNIDGKHLQIFRGIPYAEPPIGDLRLKKPVKKARWHQELSAVEYGPPCIQFMDFHKNDRFAYANMKRESEDCLYLNVFSPYDHEDESKLYPILVWIHGGSFLAGSGDTGIDMEVVARNLIFKGVALITINYRLGPLGFLNYEDGNVKEGNFGIWDMVMALQWIQANMKQFNGDPSRVTVMGESAGGAAASLLALSPKTEGLVHQAIIMSGSSMAGWAIHRHGNPPWRADNVATYLRSLLGEVPEDSMSRIAKVYRRLHQDRTLRCQKQINEKDTADAIGDDYSKEELKKKMCNYQDIKIECLSSDQTQTQIMECFRKELNFSSMLFRKALSVELGVSKMIVDDDLVPAYGMELAHKYARVPMMTGIAKKEWAHKKAHFYNLNNKPVLSKEDAEEAVFRVIEGSFHEMTSDNIGNDTLRLIANATFIRQMEADIEFVAPAQVEIDGYAANGLPVYVYSFNYLPESHIYEEEKKIYNLFGKDPVTVLRTEKNSLEAFHGLDHAYIFTKGYSSNFEVAPYTNRDEAFAKIFTNMWTNFVKNGDPSTPRFKWPAYTTNSSQHVAINLPLKVIEGDIHWPDGSFWNVEAQMMSKFIPKDSGTVVDPASELTNEERVQLSAYRRAWWALWLLVAALAIIIWSIVIYLVFKKGTSPRAQPYDNILITR
ncbi:hypothetical protein WR25_09582 [Diploscapter pachys]|uniref:Carboxylesterase type B domain-containing protein n=1 Tax=Diploscapter pachys TaxID=2018661 RepID=A0A2A2KX90_9BILA|nr:hypothetical protein WR25_09582 [Diploscapter pachys]